MHGIELLVGANGSLPWLGRSVYLPHVGVGTVGGVRSAPIARPRRRPFHNNARRSTTSGRCAWPCLAGRLNCRSSRKSKAAPVESARQFVRSSLRSWDRVAMRSADLACESLEEQAQRFSVGYRILFMNVKNYSIFQRRAAVSLSYRCSSEKGPLAPARTSDSASNGCLSCVRLPFLGPEVARFGCNFRSLGSVGGAADFMKLLRSATNFEICRN